MGGAAHAQSRIPAASPGSRACAVSAPGRSPCSSLRPDRPPCPLRAAVFSGSWGASCCSHPQPPLVCDPRAPPVPSPPRAAGCPPSARPDLGRPAPAAVCPPPARRPRGSGECPAAAACSPSQASPHSSSRLSGALRARPRPPPGPARPRRPGPAGPLSSALCGRGGAGAPLRAAVCLVRGVTRCPSSAPSPSPGARGLGAAVGAETSRARRGAWAVEPAASPVRRGVPGNLDVAGACREDPSLTEKEGKSEGPVGSPCPSVRSGPWTGPASRPPSPSQCAWALG